MHNTLFCSFLCTDLPWAYDAGIVNFIETTLIAASEFNKVTPFHPVDVAAEDTYEQFAIVNARNDHWRQVYENEFADLTDS